ncbi:hypothetical protein PFMG_04303 [Plasmodium falciparum IGH-CR14]|uniref:Uncharacterized protein n=1 Tax=Plasmodium falciparum IGH-CR14 TaxID=580059 RepID=A0A0L1IGN9_PLAFA|nr:hypothetical protein PFMG_04303 [Plasmodium falciparum IGH-CR14]
MGINKNHIKKNSVGPLNFPQNSRSILSGFLWDLGYHCGGLKYSVGKAQNTQKNPCDVGSPLTPTDFEGNISEKAGRISLYTPICFKTVYKNTFTSPKKIFTGV